MNENIYIDTINFTEDDEYILSDYTGGCLSNCVTTKMINNIKDKLYDKLENLYTSLISACNLINDDQEFYYLTKDESVGGSILPKYNENTKTSSSVLFNLMAQSSELRKNYQEYEKKKEEIQKKIEENKILMNIIIIKDYYITYCSKVNFSQNCTFIFETITKLMSCCRAVFLSL